MHPVSEDHIAIMRRALRELDIVIARGMVRVNGTPAIDVATGQRDRQLIREALAALEPITEGGAAPSG